MSFSTPRLVSVLMCALAYCTPGLARDYDILIRGGLVVDGTGSEPKKLDVGIEGDRIVAIGRLRGDTGKIAIDASRYVVTPGFIDVHSHAKSGLKTKLLSAADSLLVNGVTTVIIGPDGSSSLDLKDEREELETDGLGVNVAQLIGHGSIRAKFFGSKNRQPTAKQLEEMKAYVRRAMEDGAFGMSSGLFYANGYYAKTEEVVELSKVVGEYGGFYSSHIRDESNYTVGVLAAVEEVITIAREAKIPGVVSHIKCLGPVVWDEAPKIVEAIDKARAEGVKVYADQYPWAASQTGFSAALWPRESLSGQALRDAIQKNLDRRGGPTKIGMNKFGGKLMSEVIGDKNPIDAVIEFKKKGVGSCVYYVMKPENKVLFMQQSWTMTCSDGGVKSLNGSASTHPRNFGSFARKIRKYVVEDKSIALPFAVRSMSGLAAEVCDIKDRGFIRVGAFADVLVFDPNEVKDHATYEKPRVRSTGMTYVIVNGKIAIDKGVPNQAKTGIVLRHEFKKRIRTLAAREIRTACEKSDFKRFCTHREMMEYLAQINANSQEMLFPTFGKSVEGRELVYTVFSRPMVTNPFEAMTSGKPIVILDAGVHGDERALRESNLILIRELAEKGTEMNALLDDLVVIMIPCLNPDGTERDKRTNANNSDINRDYIKLDEPETQSYVGKILQKWHPHIQIGGHNGGVYPYNICYLAPTNAAADPALSKICDEGLFPFIDKKMKSAGYKSFYHGRGNKERWRARSPSPKIFRNYGGICNYISIVFESPSRQGMENGIKSGLVAYKSILEYCAENPEKVMGVVEKARKNTVLLGQKAQGKIPVQMKYVPEDYKVSYLIGEVVEFPGGEGEESGTKRIVTRITNADLLKKPVATKTRPRPYAYIMPSDAHKAVNLLKMHNITVEVLQQDTPIAIEAYRLEDIRHRKEDNHPEATFVTVADDTVKKVMNFPKGTFVVRTGQVMGRMISHMLEPETPENIIICNTMDDLLPQPGPNSLIPIYKLPKPTDLPIVLWVRGNDAQFVSQTVSTSMNQGGTQRVSITLKNTGTDTWSSSKGQSLGSLNPRANATWTGSTRITLPHNVTPNQEVTFTFSITAPLVDDFVNFQWQMVDDSGSNSYAPLLLLFEY